MRSVTSFAELTKEESALALRSDEEKRAFLSAFVRMSGYLRLNEGKEGLEVSSENSAIAKVVYKYLNDLYGVKARFSYTRSAGFLKRIVYHVIIDEGAEDILNDLEIDFFFPKEPKRVLATSLQTSSFFAGAFLAGGSVSSPQSSSYHLEISCKEEAFAAFLLHLIQKYSPHPFHAKTVQRRNKHVIYIKRGDEISDFLILLGAKENCLAFEDVRVSRDFASIGNRLANLDGANYRRSKQTGEKQIEQINYFVERLGWQGIDNLKLRTLMEIRLNNPDASLGELAKLLSQELGATVSKSNVNHLFRYLNEQYERAKHHDKTQK